MKKFILGLIFSLLFSASALAQGTLNPGISYTVYNKTLAVESGSAYTLPAGRAVILSWAVDYTGAPGSVTLNIQCSNDNIAWYTISSTTSTTDTGSNVGPVACRFVRVNVSAVASGVATTVTFTVLTFNNATVFSGGTVTSNISMASGTRVLLDDGTELLPGLGFRSKLDTGIWRAGSGSLDFSVSGVRRASLSSTGLITEGLILDETNQDITFARTGTSAARLLGGDSLAFELNSSGTNANTAFRITAPGTGTPSINLGQGGVYDTRFRRSAAKTVTFDDGAGAAATFIFTDAMTVTGGTSITISRPVISSSWYQSTAAGFFSVGGRVKYMSDAAGFAKLSDDAEVKSVTFNVKEAPSCTSNCGTSPSVSGVGSSFTLTMGATGVPASGFVITFATAWAAAPQCTGSMALAGMVVGKLPLTFATTTTTLTVVTNGTAPASADMYHFICHAGQ